MDTQAALRMFLTLMILCVSYNGDYGRASPEIDIQLNALNKPALKTIKSQDGDIIDCVDIYKQPAFDHPDLRDHKIQMEPSVELFPKSNTSSKLISSQIWTKSGSCPVRTVPIRRVSREDISRATSPSRFGRKTPRRVSFLDNAFQHNKTNFNLTGEKLRIPLPRDRSEAMFVAVGYNFLGAQSDINVWNPPRVEASDYSSAQIWLYGGGSDLYESLEAGWIVNPSVFGDTRTRFFTYWTKDSYQKTGCFNLLCSGFVQTTAKFALGAVIQPLSSSSGDQYTISPSVYLDPNNGNWWLAVKDVMVGYWPAKLFEVLKHSATAVQWGGEVHSPNVKKKPHTRTAMGSGQFASYLYGNAAFHTNIRIKDYSMQIKFPQYLSSYSEEHDCYSALQHRDSYKAEPRFYFGGPGQNRFCP